MARPELDNYILQERVRPKEFPQNIDQIRDDWRYLTARIAIGARQEVLHRGTVAEQLKKNPEQDKGLLKKDMIFDLDTMAADNLETGFALFAYGTNVISCEGHKEKDAKKLGKAPKILRGWYGSGDSSIGVDIDPIEGTDAVAGNLNGGMSFASISSCEGIMKTPQDERGEDIDYMEKLYGPARLKGKISLDASPRENLETVAKVYGIDPSKITVTYLNRDRNQELIDAVEAFGAIANPIKFGDLEPALESIVEPEDPQKEGIRLAWGSGGWQEGVGVGVAAKAIGAFAEGRVVEKKIDAQGNELFVVHNKILQLDDLVPGKPEHCMVVLSAVTDCPRLGIRGVDMEERRVATYVIDKQNPRGLRIVNRFDDLAA